MLPNEITGTLSMTLCAYRQKLKVLLMWDFHKQMVCVHLSSKFTLYIKNDRYMEWTLKIDPMFVVDPCVFPQGFIAPDMSTKKKLPQGRLFK